MKHCFAGNWRVYFYVVLTFFTIVRIIGGEFAVATLSEIAREAGVTIKTVANILGRQEPEIRPSAAARAKRVRDIAARLNYRPNAAASAMRSGSFNNISLIIGGTGKNHGFGWVAPSMLSGMYTGAHHAGVTLSVAELSDDHLTSEATMPKLLRDRCSDGLIVNYIVDMPTRLIDLMDRYRIPSIWTNVKLPNNCVRPDDLAAGVMATEYLLKLGHRKIGYIGWWGHGDQGHYSQVERLHAYEQTMRAAGLIPRMALRTQASIDNPAFDIAETWLDQLDHPTAIICYKQIDAILLRFVIERRGLRIPQDISIVAFGDEWGHTTEGLPFTSVDIPFAAIGRTAVQMLITRIQDDGKPQPTVIMPSTLYEGSTAAKPKKH